MTQLDHARRILTRRRMLALIGVAAAVAAMAVAWNVDEKSQPCTMVHRFIDFNRDSLASLKQKTSIVPAGVMGQEDKFPSPADYQAWLDGLQQHADRVTAPGLSEHAQRAAQSARQFWVAGNQANDEFGNEPVLNPHEPPSLKTAAAANREFDTQIAVLEHACPR